MDHSVKLNKDLTELQIRAIKEMEKFPCRDDYTDEELDQIRKIDMDNEKRDYKNSGLYGLNCVDSFWIGECFLRSKKEYKDLLEIDLEIQRLKTIAAWLETRKPRFMSKDFEKAHVAYVQQRRILNVLKASMEKLEDGKVTKTVGEWI